VTLALLCALAPACRRASRGDDDLLAARQAAALAWVNALAAGDGATLGHLTAAAFIFRGVGRGVGPDQRCEGVVVGPRALDAWFACARAKDELRPLPDAWKLAHEAPPHSPEGAAFQKYLPRVVDADEAWSRFVGAEERQRAREPFEAFTKEAGRDGDWVTIAASWLHASLVLRLQVVGPVAAPRVHAVLVDVTRTSE
jgi:hypothetical protein